MHARSHTYDIRSGVNIGTVGVGVGVGDVANNGG